MVYAFFMGNQQEIHIGSIIKEELDRQGRTVAWFATQLCYSHNHIYKIFNKPSIDTGLLFRISKILNHDFFLDISEEYVNENVSLSNLDKNRITIG